MFEIIRVNCINIFEWGIPFPKDCMCTQLRFRSACLSAQPDQKLHRALWAQSVLIWTSKTLINLILPMKFESTSLSVQEKSFEIDVNYLGFPIETILPVSDRQVTPILHIKFGVSWLYSSGKEVQNRFSKWQSLNFQP